jgi:coenzyme F420-dependent glucose-6-phosphate dehydrogenase
MPISLGYKLSSEEHGPGALVQQAVVAERSGFDFALVSDHFHPWSDSQGQSPFVWAVLGAIAQATDTLKIGTGVTCPTVRMHPAIVAQAAATVAAMMPGRFFLGVGAGENLNEHIVGQGWPEPSVRQDRLVEAIEVIRLLFQGGKRSHHGRHYTVEGARLYTLPDELPKIHVAIAGERGAEIAARLGDGMIGVKPERELIQAYEKAGGRGPKYGELHVCFDEDEKRARKIAHEKWSFAGIPGQLWIELPLPRHFEEAGKLVTEEKLAEAIVCGADPDAHLLAIQKFIDAGYDHVCIHQIGPHQEPFARFYQQEILPRLHAREERASGAHH